MKEADRDEESREPTDENVNDSRSESFLDELSAELKQFKEENLRQQKRHADFRKKEENLLSELEWIKGIAHKIDKENFYLVKRHMELKVEYET